MYLLFDSQLENRVTTETSLIEYRLSATYWTCNLDEHLIADRHHSQAQTYASR